MIDHDMTLSPVADILSIHYGYAMVTVAIDIQDSNVILCVPTPNIDTPLNRK
jgi:hypothetical protein